MKTRITKLKNLLNKNNLDAVFISSIPNIVYLTGYSGFSKDEREAYLFIARLPSPGTGGQVAQPRRLTDKTSEVIGYIITDGRYSEAVRVYIPHFQLIERTITNPLKNIFYKLAKKYNIRKLGIEENNITVAEYKKLQRCFNDLNHFSINNLRSIKDSNEIAHIKKACALGDKAFAYILKKIKKGVSEKEIAHEIELFIKKAGGELSFPTVVAFGKNSAVPHHQTSDQRLTTNDQLVLLDFGVKLNNYCSDITRTVFFGSATAEQKRMYETVHDAQKRAIEYLKSFYSSSEAQAKSRSNSSRLRSNNIIRASEVDKVARDYIISQGYPSIPHSLGHGIGIEVHEAPNLSPNSKDILKKGMMFSIEPGIYVSGFGGVRIEDLVVFDKSGPRLLTRSSSVLTLVG